MKSIMNQSHMYLSGKVMTFAKERKGEKKMFPNEDKLQKAQMATDQQLIYSDQRALNEMVGGEMTRNNEISTMLSNTGQKQQENGKSYVKTKASLTNISGFGNWELILMLTIIISICIIPLFIILYR